MLKYGPLGMRFDDGYRTIPEAPIVEMLVPMGWADASEFEKAKRVAQEALQNWIHLGLGFCQATTGERLFDPVEVINFMKRACLDGRDGFWKERNVQAGRQRVSHLANLGSLPRADCEEGSQPFTVDFKRSFNLRSIPVGTPLRLRMPLPLEGDFLQNLQVTPLGERDGKVETKISSGRLERRLIASGQAKAVLAARLNFTARRQEPHPGEKCAEINRALYLKDREGLIVVSERIRTLAKALAGSGAPASKALQAFWDYINHKLLIGFIHYDQIDPVLPCDWVLDSGWCDCQLGSSLFIALCRAHGLPARLIGGHFLYQTGPAKHFWAEVWIEDQGWTPYDLVGWDLSAGGRDMEWRDRFFGRVDYRLTVERLPREFTGALGVPIPQVWTTFNLPVPGGMELYFADVSGKSVYCDTLRIMG